MPWAAGVLLVGARLLAHRAGSHLHPTWRCSPWGEAAKSTSNKSVEAQGLGCGCGEQAAGPQASPCVGVSETLLAFVNRKLSSQD